MLGKKQGSQHCRPRKIRYRDFDLTAVWPKKTAGAECLCSQRRRPRCQMREPQFSEGVWSSAGPGLRMGKPSAGRPRRAHGAPPLSPWSIVMLRWVVLWCPRSIISRFRSTDKKKREVAAGCMKTLRWCAGLRLQRKRPHKFLGAIEAVTVLSLICRCTAHSRNGICLCHASGHATERTAPIDFRRLGSSVRNRATKAAAVAWIATHGSCEIA